MRPEPRFTIARAKPWVSSNAANTLVSNTERNTVIRISTIGPDSMMPALLNNMSVSIANALARSISFRTSSLITCIPMLSALAALRNSQTCGHIWQPAITLWPRLARPKATPWPKPDATPVIRTVFPIALLPSSGLHVAISPLRIATRIACAVVATPRRLRIRRR